MPNAIRAMHGPRATAESTQNKKCASQCDSISQTHTHTHAGAGEHRQPMKLRIQFQMNAKINKMCYFVRYVEYVHSSVSGPGTGCTFYCEHTRARARFESALYVIVCQLNATKNKCGAHVCNCSAASIAVVRDQKKKKKKKKAVESKYAYLQSQSIWWQTWNI